MRYEEMIDFVRSFRTTLQLTPSFVLILLIVMACAKGKDGTNPMNKDLSQINIPDSWQVLQVKDGETDTIVRFNEGLNALKGHPALPIRVGIAIPVPAGTTIDGLNSIEDSLFDLSDGSNNRFIVAAIITAPEFREFMLFAADTSAAKEIAEKLQKRHPDYRFQHYSEADPNWDGYSVFIK